MLDLVGRERPHLGPVGEPRVPRAVQRIEGAVARAQPRAERVEGGRRKIVVERVGRDRDRELVAQVVRERRVAGVPPCALARFAAGPGAPFRIPEAVLAHEGGRIARGHPLVDEPVPVTHARVPLETEAAVDDIFDVVRHAHGHPAVGFRAAVDHACGRTELAQAPNEEIPAIRVAVYGVADPENDLVARPWPRRWKRCGRIVRRAKHPADANENCQTDRCTMGQLHRDSPPALHITGRHSTGAPLASPVVRDAATLTAGCRSALGPSPFRETFESFQSSPAINSENSLRSHSTACSAQRRASRKTETITIFDPSVVQNGFHPILSSRLAQRPAAQLLAAGGVG